MARSIIKLIVLGLFLLTPCLAAAQEGAAPEAAGTAAVPAAAPAEKPAVPGVKAPLKVRVRPNHIDIRSFFNGQKLLIDGDAPAGSDVVVKIEGEREELVLDRKGKVALLWMTVGKVKIGNAPTLYLLATSKDLKSIAPAGLLKKLGLGYQNLTDSMTVEPADLDRGRMLADYLALTEEKGLYQVRESVVEIEPAGGSGVAYRAVIDAPATIKPGEYELSVYAVRNGAVAARDTEKLTVAKVSVPKALHSMAMEHGTLYGVASVVLAVVFGYVIGIVAGGKGSH